jgi:hypothetical protein
LGSTLLAICYNGAEKHRIIGISSPQSVIPLR